MSLLHRQVKREASHKTNCTLFEVLLASRNWLCISSNFLLNKKVLEKKMAKGQEINFDTGSGGMRVGVVSLRMPLKHAAP